MCNWKRIREHFETNALRRVKLAATSWVAKWNVIITDLLVYAATVISPHGKVVALRFHSLNQTPSPVQYASLHKPWSNAHYVCLLTGESYGL